MNKRKFIGGSPHEQETVKQNKSFFNKGDQIDQHDISLLKFIFNSDRIQLNYTHVGVTVAELHAN